MKHCTRILTLFLFISFAFAQTQLGSDIDGEAANDRSGYSVSMNSAGDRVAIGARSNDGTASDAGHVRIYEYSNSSWTQLGSDIDGEAAADQSGISVSMNSAGDRVAIGAYHNDGTAINAGHVRIYEYSNSSWTQLGSDIDGEAASDYSGISVSMNSAGDRVAIGATGNNGTASDAGHVRIYEYSNSSWTQLGSDIDGEAASDNSGRQVSMNSAGDRVAIGAWSNDGTASGAGHVRIYEYSNSSWTQLGSDIDGEAASDLSGYSVSMNSAGNRVAIGASSNDGTASQAGHVRIYEYSNSSWTQLGSDIDGEAESDYSGISVSMNSAGDRVAIGADLNDGTGSNAGHVRVYGVSTSTFQPQTTAALQTAVDLWVSDSTTALSTYGEINTWDVSLITDMSELFQSKTTFNDTIGNWDVSNVIDMGSMFNLASSFNQDLSSWDVSSVTNMHWIFRGTNNSNQDLSNWDVSSVTDMSGVFYSSSFNGDLSSWDVSSVTNMNGMFYLASSFSQDLSSWDVDSVTNMAGMFHGAGSFNGDISTWDVSGVTSMQRMFRSADSFNGDLSSWDVSSVTDMSIMFFYANSFNQDISNWDISNVTTMNDMFGNAAWNTPDLSDTNKCLIHSAFQNNDAWPYDWSLFCGTYVPDDNFEQALIDLGYDDVLDDYVVTDSITSVTVLDVSNDSISDLTGIQDFTALTRLECNDNQLTSLDVSNNTALTRLECNHNQLTSLDVSNNTSLTYLDCWANDLTSLDVSSNTALFSLYCGGNELTILDVSNNTVLGGLSCHNNDLTSLNVSANTALTFLECYGNPLGGLDLSSNTALNVLRCLNNQLDSLDVSANTALTFLHCGNNQFTSLDISNNIALTTFYCLSNPLDSLDVSANTALTRLGVSNNQLTSLDVSNNTSLTWMQCNGNQLTSLDVSSNTELTNLGVKDNLLTSLDVSSNTALTGLGCDNNQLTSLDVSSNTALNHLICNNNQLTYLNMKNGVTDALTTFNAANNSSLTCIETLDPDYATANWTYANGNIDEGVLFFETCSPGCTDPYAGNYDSTATNDDGSCTNYPDNGEYSLSFDGVDDGVTINDNQSLDLTTASITAWVKSTTNDSLWQTILSKGPDPYESYGIFLKYGTILHIVNVIDGSRLYWEPTDTLTLNDWTYVAVTFDGDTSRAYINGIEVGANALSGSVTSNDYDLEFGIRSGGTALNGMLDEIALWDTVLTQSEIQNSMFTGFSGDEDGLQGYWKFDTGADTIAYDHSGNANHGGINGAAWNVSLTYVPDDNFEQALIDLGYDDVMDDSVMTANINSVTTLNVSNDSISDLTGIEDFTALSWLNCHSNQLTSLNLSNNTALTWLSCGFNDLEYLNISNSPFLDFLWCQQNNLTVLDLSNNPLLTEIQCHANDLDSLNLSSNTLLEKLSCKENQLTSLDINNNTALEYISFERNQLTSIDFSNNIAIKTINCKENELTNLDVSNNLSLRNLQAKSNQITTLDFSNNDSLAVLNLESNSLTNISGINNKIFLEELSLQRNNLDSVDISGCVSLGSPVNLYNNDLTSIDLIGNVSMTHLNAKDNELTSIDLSTNDLLEEIDLFNNALTSIDVSDKLNLVELRVYSNSIDSIDVSNSSEISVLRCESNELVYLNMRNGVTDGLTSFNATNNDSLGCIEILDPDYATANWTYANGNIDDGVTFSVICGSSDLSNWHVDTTGSDRQGTGTAGNPFATIQVGINASSDGSSVLVGAGTYVENINYNGKNISILGANRETTIIDGDSSGSVVRFEAGEDSTASLSRFTLRNGTGTMINETQSKGGGIYCTGSSPTLTNLKITNNTATTWGGGIHCEFTSNPVITDVFIMENSTNDTAWGQGGGLYCWYSAPKLTNVLIANNSSIKGGGVYLGQEGSWAKLTNVTITDNNSVYGGGIWLGYLPPGTQPADKPTVLNSIIWNNTPQQIYYSSEFVSNEMDISYSSIEGGLDSIVTNNNGTVNWGAGNIDNSPFFCEPDSGDYTLAENSSCVGSGEGGANMGAFGIGCGVINQGIYVPENFATIQGGIDAAFVGDTVFVAAGTYVEKINFNGKNIAMIGAGQDSTIIDGNQDSTVVTFSNGEDSSSVISGFTIKNGQGRNGGGIHCGNNSSPRIQNLVIINNVADFGGGIQCFNSSPTIQNVIITGNTAGNDGGGIHCFNSSPTLDNVEITDNIGTWKGGGLGVFSSSDVISQHVTMNNNSANSGAGVYCSGSNPTFTNSILWNSMTDEIHINSGSVTASYSDVLGGWTGQGNINTEPLFCDPSNGDYYLAQNSPCIGTGENGSNIGAYGAGCVPILTVVSEVLPETYALHQNYPNPFNPITTLRYDLPEDSHVNITVYDMLGRVVKTMVNQTQNAGFRFIVWDATNDYNKPVSAGIYLYQIQAGEYISTKKMVLLK